MTGKANDAATIGKELETTLEYVRDCQARISKGEELELNGLDDSVIALCDAIARLPKAQADAVEEQMGALIEALEELSHIVKEQEAKQH